MGKFSFTKKGTRSWFGPPFKEDGEWFVVYHKANKHGFTNYLFKSMGPF